MTQLSQAAWRPRVFVGAPTGSLNPQIPSPVYRPCPIAIEIADGIGFGIDGQSLIVDDGGTDGVYHMTGHLEDGSYPQRDFSIERRGSETRIDGFYGWQRYTMHRDQNVLSIAGENDEQSSSVTEMSQGLVVFGKYPAQRFFVGMSNSDVVTVEGYDKTVKAEIVYAEDHISIRSNVPERSFEISKTVDGFHVEGAHRDQDFDVKMSPEGFVIQGYYPQQRYVISKTA